MGMTGLAATMQEKPDEKRHDYLLMSHGDLRFCVPLPAVERVFPLMYLQPLPGGPDYVVGLMNLHGECIPVLDLGLRLGVPDVEPYTLETEIALCSMNGRRIGLITRALTGVESLEGALQMRPELQESGLPFMAVAATAGGLALLLDIEQLSVMDFSLPTSDCAVDAEMLREILGL